MATLKEAMANAVLGFPQLIVLDKEYYYNGHTFSKGSILNLSFDYIGKEFNLYCEDTDWWGSISDGIIESDRWVEDPNVKFKIGDVVIWELSNGSCHQSWFISRYDYYKKVWYLVSDYEDIGCDDVSEYTKEGYLYTIEEFKNMME